MNALKSGEYSAMDRAARAWLADTLRFMRAFFAVAEFPWGSKRAKLELLPSPDWMRACWERVKHHPPVAASDATTAGTRWLVEHRRAKHDAGHLG